METENKSGSVFSFNSSCFYPISPHQKQYTLIISYEAREYQYAQMKTFNVSKLKSNNNILASFFKIK